MKYLFSFTVACCLLLSSCRESTNPEMSPDDNFPTNARDFMFAGNVGTEIVFLETYWSVDTNGVKTVSATTDTTFWTILERDVSHPVGAKAIRIREELHGANGIVYNSRDSIYFAYHNDGISFLPYIRDTFSLMIFKNPLTLGARWSERDVSGRYIRHIVKSVGEVINTSYKQMKTVRIESHDSTMYDSNLQIETWKYYYAPEVFMVRTENSMQVIYPSKKIATSTQVTDLIRYTKK